MIKLWIIYWLMLETKGQLHKYRNTFQIKLDKK